MARTQLDLLARLEQELIDRTVPLADALRTCRALARRTQAADLLQWVTAELEGYRPLTEVPDYRRVLAPIMYSVAMPYRGIVTQPFNVQVLPEGIREPLSEPVPLNQSVDELEAIADQYEARRQPLHLEVFGSELLLGIFNKNNPYGPQFVAMTWAIDPPIIRGVLGQVRTRLDEFAAELRAEVGDGDQLPSATQTDEAFRAAVPWAILNNSPVTIVTATTKSGDIMPTGPRTTIKNNKTKVSDSTGNVSVASAHVSQLSGGEIDIARVCEFIELLSQVAPTLGLAADQEVELQGAADDLVRAASGPTPEKGRLRRALDGVMRVLRAAGPSAAQRLVLGMGDEVIRELGEEVVRSLPH